MEKTSPIYTSDLNSGLHAVQQITNRILCQLSNLNPDMEDHCKQKKAWNHCPSKSLLSLYQLFFFFFFLIMLFLSLLKTWNNWNSSLYHLWFQIFYFLDAQILVCFFRKSKAIRKLISLYYEARKQGEWHIQGIVLKKKTADQIEHRLWKNWAKKICGWNTASKEV